MKNRLKDIRKKTKVMKPITQMELAERSGVSKQTIIGLEKGTIEYPSSQVMEKIAKALGRKVSDIFYD